MSDPSLFDVPSGPSPGVIIIDDPISQHDPGNQEVYLRYFQSRQKPEWADDNLGTRWWAFHLDHPEVYNALSRLAFQLVDKGYTHLGIAMLWETLRYETMLGAETPGEDVVRLNNNHRALYARFLMEREPKLEGIFETRRRDA